MIYIIITAIGSIRQVDQLTDEILEAYKRGALEVVQVSAPSGSVAMGLAETKGDELIWAPLIKWEE